MVKKLAIAFVLFIFSFCNLYSQTISARAFTDKSDYQVGDYINYTIEITHNHDLQVFKPPLDEFAKDIDVIKTDEPVVEEKGGKSK